MIRIVLTDDHPVVRSGIRQLLEKTSDIVVVGEASDGAEALRLVNELSPDVLLLDMEMPSETGVQVARQLHATRSPVRILALSAYDDEQYIVGLLACGAAGYLTKEAALETIAEAVRGVAHGEEGWLSRRAAAQVAAWGWTNDHIAEVLSISERTVRFHLTNVYNKLGVTSRGAAIAWAVREGLENRGSK